MIDHRNLGRELEIFASDPLIGAGLPIWLPAGAAARHAVEEYLREVERRAGYRHVYSAPMAKREMYQRSGHLEHFADEMFAPIGDGDDALMLRPSMCPHHAIVYASRGRSYRELPLRIAELGGMYRDERSGVLGGLSRVRSIWLNDAHIFCARSQASEEVARVLALMRRVHAALGVRPSEIRLSLPGPGGKYVDDPEAWRLGESILRAALDGVSYVEALGEAAFYGPKIDVQIVDPVGREWTLATVQVDFHQPARFNLSYVDADGERVRPVMVHRSLVGSMERLFGHLIEVHEGAFPAWYAPVQAVVLPVSDGQAAPAEAFARRCVEAGLRVEVDGDGSLGARVREARLRKVPYLAVIGPAEASAGQVSVRQRGNEDLGPLAADAALGHLSDACRPPLALPA